MARVIDLEQARRTSAAADGCRGDTLVVCDARGDVDVARDRSHGVFVAGARVLSQWRLTVDGRRPRPVSAGELGYGARFLLAGDGWSLVRRRETGDGLSEQLTVLNQGDDVLELELLLEAAADFAEPDAAGHAAAREGRSHRLVEGRRLVLGFAGAGFVHETWIAPNVRGAQLTEDGLRFRPRVEPGGLWSARIDVRTPVTALRRGNGTIDGLRRLLAAA
jgi:hypothetical protein